MSALDKLIASAKTGSAFALEGEALADLRKVFRANAREPNHKNRVSIQAFVEHLRTEHKIQTTPFTLVRFVRTKLKRGWYK